MDPRDMIAGAFYDVVAQFLTTLSESYPTRFSNASLWPKDRKKELLERFVTDYGHLFKAAKEHDRSVFADPILSPYKDLLDANSEVIFWQYSDHLVRFGDISGMYTSIPNNVMSIIGTSIANLKSQLDAGTLDPKYMNPMELGQDIMKQLNPADLAGLMTQMTSNQGQMMEMMNTALSMMDSFKKS